MRIRIKQTRIKLEFPYSRVPLYSTRHINSPPWETTLIHQCLTFIVAKQAQRLRASFSVVRVDAAMACQEY